MMGSAFGTIRKDLSWTRRHLAKDALSGMKIAVGGGTSGIGRALARALVAKGAVAERLGTNRGVDRPKPRVVIMGFPSAVQLRIPRLLYLPHTALDELGADLVRPELRAGGQRHGEGIIAPTAAAAVGSLRPPGRLQSGCQMDPRQRSAFLQRRSRCRCGT